MSITTYYTSTVESRYKTDENQGDEEAVARIQTFTSSNDGIISLKQFSEAIGNAHLRGWPVTKTVIINTLPPQPVPMRTYVYKTTITTTTFEVTETISRSKAESQFP